MKIRSSQAGQQQPVPAGASDARAQLARGHKLLALAEGSALVAPAQLGLSRGAVDALGRSLLEGAVLVAERRLSGGE